MMVCLRTRLMVSARAEADVGLSAAAADVKVLLSLPGLPV